MNKDTRWTKRNKQFKEKKNLKRKKQNEWKDKAKKVK